MRKKPRKQDAGKGDKPRNCFSNDFRTNYEEINWGELAQKKKDHKFIKKY